MLGPDGSPRLRGVLGRVGQAVKVKGMFLHPAQIAAVMSGVDGVADYRFVIGRSEHVDSLQQVAELRGGIADMFRGMTLFAAGTTAADRQLGRDGVRAAFGVTMEPEPMLIGVAWPR